MKVIQILTGDVNQMTLCITRTHIFLRPLIVLVALLGLFLLRPTVVSAASITVDDDCSLANAIRSANGDAQSSDMNSCETGDSGADTISLGRDVELYEALPEITSELTIEGHHHTLRRASSAGTCVCCRSHGPVT